MRSTAAGTEVELGLTLPIFLIYQIGILFLGGIRNGADPVTTLLFVAVRGDRLLYLAVTLAIGLAFFIAITVSRGGRALGRSSFFRIALEGAFYAVTIRVAASFIVGRLFMTRMERPGPLVGIVLSAGAGFYEELTFRVLLFGLVARMLLRLVEGQKPDRVGLRFTSVGGGAVLALWAVVAALVFSSMHYVGPLGDPFDAASFVFRWTVGLMLTAIYAMRGFAASVWTHTLYDVWVVAI